MTQARGRSLDRHALVRRANEQAVLAAVTAHGSLTRAEIAQRTGLSKPTTLGIVSALHVEGLVRFLPGEADGPGRVPELVAAEPRARLVVGIDLGGSKVRVAAADLDGLVLAEHTEATDRRDAPAVVGQLARMARATVEETGVAWRKVAGVAVGTPGVVQPSGALAMGANVDDLGGLDLARELRRLLRVTARVDNDVNLAALGEQAAGMAKDCATFAVVAIGTGLGAGLVIDGRLVRGHRGAAGEVAYLPIGVAPTVPAARRRGSLEVAAAGSGIVASLRRHIAQGAPTALGRRSRVEQVLAAAEAGDAVARAVVAEEADLLAQAILSIAAMIDPEMIVLTGGIGSNPALLGPVVHAVDAIAPFPIRVETSALGDRAGVVGAVALAQEHARLELLGRSPM